MVKLAVVQKLNYSLTVIEDEAVPLAGGSLFDSNRFFPLVITMMLFLCIGMAVSLYYIKCRSYQKRILELGSKKRVSCNSWNLRRLKETTAEIEWELAGDEEQEL